MNSKVNVILKCYPGLTLTSRIVVAVLGLIFATQSPILSQQVEMPTIRVNVTTRLNAVGGAHVEAITKFEPVKLYEVVKTSMPNLYVLFRDVIGNYRSGMEVDHD